MNHSETLMPGAVPKTLLVLGVGISLLAGLVAGLYGLSLAAHWLSHALTAY